MPAKVDKKKCNGNGACAEACGVKAITLVGGKAVISDECVECGACIAECPNQAISLPRKV